MAWFKDIIHCSEEHTVYDSSTCLNLILDIETRDLCTSQENDVTFNSLTLIYFSMFHCLFGLYRKLSCFEIFLFIIVYFVENKIEIHLMTHSSIQVSQALE